MEVAAEVWGSVVMSSNVGEGEAVGEQGAAAMLAVSCASLALTSVGICRSGPSTLARKLTC